MSHTIRVKNLFNANEYDSLVDATNAAKGDINKSEKINGRIVTGYSFDGNRLVLEFDNNLYLVVSPNISTIKWDIVSEKPQMKDQLNDYDIEFEFNTIGKFKWNWKKILDNFIGKQTAISPSEQYLFIFTKGGEEYMFDALVDCDFPNKIYLYFAET